MGKKWFYACLIITLIVVFALFYISRPIFNVVNEEGEVFFKKVVGENRKQQVCMLEYQYTTGAGWHVLDCTESILKNQNIILKTKYDPRLLKDNSDFTLDYTAKMIVIFDKYEKTVYDNEEVYVLNATDITILRNTAKRHYTLMDFTLTGICKHFAGLFCQKCSWSI